MNDPTTLDSVSFGRRRFLQAIAAGATIASLPPWLAAHAADATPLGPADGVLVLLTMAGGNDGLNTFVPTGDGHYYDLRQSLSIRPGSALPLTGGRGLHPALPFMKRMWDQNMVAVVDGVGHQDATLSHFVSMAQYMSATGNSVVDGTGWLGRVNDQISSGPYTTMSISSSIPLLTKGRSRPTMAISHSRSNLLPSGSDSPVDGRQHAALMAMGAGNNGLGRLGNQLADTAARSVTLSNRLDRMVEDDRDEPEVITRMRLAARLINADIGVRIVSVLFGDFDTHANQMYMHNERMTELNTALEVFFTTLQPAMLGRTLVLGTSEFGRRPAANGSGTDHGTTNSLFAIGSRVNGGFHGAAPSLAGLGRWDNPTPSVDFRTVYANVISTWLGGDAAEIVGRNHPNLGFLRSPDGSSPPLAFPAADGETPVARRASLIRLYLAYFDRPPDDDGFNHWYGAYRSGTSLRSISAAFASSAEFKQRYGSLANAEFVKVVYRNVMGREADSSGLRHWTSVLDNGGSRGAVMTQFSESNEYRKASADRVWKAEQAATIGRLYFAYLGRAGDLEGLTYWLNREAPAENVSQAFANSDEFKRRYGSLGNAEFVDLVYRNVLGRAPEPSGRRHWLSVLNGGAPRGRVMLAFSNGEEFVKRVRKLVYQA